MRRRRPVVNLLLLGLLLLTLGLTPRPAAANSALLDPALPRDLLPPEWIGARAVKLFHRQHAKWLPDATREWGRISRQAR